MTLSGRGTIERARRAVPALALATALVATGAEAQNRPPPSAEQRAEMEERFRRQMNRVVRERLELSAEDADVLSELVQSFEGRRRELRRSELATRRRVEALMLEGGTDDQEARELLERLVELRREEGALFEEEQAALLEVLTPSQVLRFQALREEMGRRIRNLRRGNDDGPRRRGGVRGFPRP